MRILASAVGQYDNVGDTVLRRGFLDHLRTIAPLRVYVGDKTADYVSGLGLQPDDIAVTDSKEWRSAVSRTLTKGGIYAFDTGETEAERAFARRYLKLAPLLAVNRLRGGTAVQLGVGVRASTPWRHPISTVLRLCDMVSWRDEKSRRMMGLGTVTPDWAFALGSSDDFLQGDRAPRPYLAIAFRQGLSHMARDKPSDAWVDSVRAMSLRLNLQPIVVAQIERDGPLAQELADRLGCDALLWLDDNHARQEARLRETYRRSALVLSDRLHAVVIAATEGAVPIALSTGPMDKVSRTLEGAGILRTSVQRDLSDAAAANAVVDDALARRAEIMAAVVSSRERLEAVTAALRERIQAKAKS
jgi:polysaccharide pyruvyl transferase WcaK-like protein